MKIIASPHCPIFVIVLLFSLLSACDNSTRSATQITGQTMGTTYNIIIPKRPSPDTAGTLKLAIDKRLKDLNQNLSTWIPSSHISTFNQSKSTDWLEQPSELVRLVEAATEISQLTDGAYDITVGPVVNLWGFGAAKSAINTIPTDDALRSAIERIGYEKLSMQMHPPALQKSRVDLEIDLSSIAKGYGVDQIGVLLEGRNIHRYLVEIGGEVRTRGLSPRNDKWRIAVEKPGSAQPTAEQALRLQDAHLATSGDYRNYFEQDGIRYSHTIDARNGTPIKHKLASVTVMHKSTMLADAWATALLVLGEEAGFDLAKQHSVAAYFIFRDGDAFSYRHTETFSPVLESE